MLVFNCEQGIITKGEWLSAINLLFKVTCFEGSNIFGFLKIALLNWHKENNHASPSPVFPLANVAHANVGVFAPYLRCIYICEFRMRFRIKLARFF